jgi:hypothetical protein
MSMRKSKLKAWKRIEKGLREKCKRNQKTGASPPRRE